MAGEKIRWTEQALEFKKQAIQLVGDVVILCGFLCYSGPFNQEYRTKIRERWYGALQERGIPFTKNLVVVENLVDQPTVGGGIGGLASSYKTELRLRDSAD